MKFGNKINSPWHVGALITISALFLADAKSWFDNSYSFLPLHDAYTQTFPWMDTVLESWRNLDIPLWTWGTNLGTSLIGELQPGVLYPSTILLSALNLDTITTINILIFIHAALAAVGVYLCNRILKGNILIGISLSLAWSYYLLDSRAFGQANLYYGFCYISLISASLLQKFLTAKKKKVIDKKLGFQFSNSLLTAGLISLSILAGHTYATIGILFFWIIFAGVSFRKDLISKNFYLNKLAPRKFLWFLSTTGIFFLLSAGQALATSEYFRLSRKWWGSGSTTYPHIVPLETLKETGVNLSQMTSQLILGEQISNSAIESSMMPGSNILFICTVICFITSQFVQAKVICKFKSSPSTIQMLKCLKTSDNLFVASIILSLITILSTAEISNFLIGAKIYQSIPIVNSIRLPGRIIPCIELGLILSMLSYLSLAKAAYTKNNLKKYSVLMLTISVSLIFLTESAVVSHSKFIKMGQFGKLSPNNPNSLLSSDCDTYFRSIKKKSYGLIKLSEDSSLHKFPKNMGDINGYPRFTDNIFRSSLTIESLKVDKDDLANIYQIQNKDNGFECTYKNNKYFFSKSKNIPLSKFSTFIADPYLDSKDTIPTQVNIANHEINFPNGYNLFINNPSQSSKYFVKTPFFPGWIAQTTDGKKFELINNNSFLGYPQNLRNKSISRIYYHPKWIFFVYTQLAAWILFGFLAIMITVLP